MLAEDSSCDDFVTLQTRNLAAELYKQNVYPIFTVCDGKKNKLRYAFPCEHNNLSINNFLHPTQTRE